MYSEHDAVLRGEGWRRKGGDIKYNRSSRSQDGVTLYCLTWTFEFPHDNDTCFFAHCYPYTYSDLSRDLQRWTCDPARSQYCKLRTLCRSLAGNTVYLLTITSPSINPSLAVNKKAVVVTARVHPGETNGSWMVKGFLDFILSDSSDAQLLRDTFIFKVIPMLNLDGVIVGNYLCSLSGRDLNRNYKSLLKDSYPCIWHARAMVKREKTKEALLQLKSWLERNPHVVAHFPVEVRFAKGDDILLSPCYQRDSCYMNIIMYRPYGKDVLHQDYWSTHEAT